MLLSFFSNIQLQRFASLVFAHLCHDLPFKWIILSIVVPLDSFVHVACAVLPFPFFFVCSLLTYILSLFALCVQLHVVFCSLSVLWLSVKALFPCIDFFSYSILILSCFFPPPLLPPRFLSLVLSYVFLFSLPSFLWFVSWRLFLSFLFSFSSNFFLAFFTNFVLAVSFLFLVIFSARSRLF